MKCNVGGADRTVRIVIGIALIVIAAVYPITSTTAQVIAFLVGAVLLVTGLLRYCPLSHAVGMNTCKREGHGNPG